MADDYAGGFIRFENDVGLQVESFWASHQPAELQIELFCRGLRIDESALLQEEGRPVARTPSSVKTKSAAQMHAKAIMRGRVNAPP